MVIYIAFTTSSPLGDSLYMWREVVRGAVDNKGISLFVNAIGDG